MDYPGYNPTQNGGSYGQRSFFMLKWRSDAGFALNKFLENQPEIIEKKLII